MSHFAREERRVWGWALVVVVLYLVAQAVTYDPPAYPAGLPSSDNPYIYRSDVE